MRKTKGREMKVVKQLKAGSYKFEKYVNHVTHIADSFGNVASVFFCPIVRKWVAVDPEAQKVTQVDRIAAVKLCKGQDYENGLSQAAIAIDIDQGIWIVDADWLEDVLAGYVEIIFSE